MDKKYSVDDILSEVKRKKEQQSPADGGYLFSAQRETPKQTFAQQDKKTQESIKTHKDKKQNSAHMDMQQLEAYFGRSQKGVQPVLNSNEETPPMQAVQPLTAEQKPQVDRYATSEVPVPFLEPSKKEDALPEQEKANAFSAPVTGNTLEQTRIDISVPLQSKQAGGRKDGFRVQNLQPGDATRLDMAFAHRQPGMRRQQAQLPKEEPRGKDIYEVQPDLEGGELSGIEEYNSPQEAKSIQADLAHMRLSIIVRTAVSLAGFLFLSYLSLAGYLGIALWDLFDRTVQPMAFLVTNILVLFVLIAVNFQAVFGGLTGMLKLKANGDAFAAIPSLAVLMQLLVSLFYPQQVAQGGLQIFSCVAAGGLFLNAAGKLMMVNRMLRNFRFISSDKAKYTAGKVKNENFAWELTRSLDIDQANVLVSRPTRFATGFLEYSYSDDPVDSLSRLLAPIGLCGALLVAVLSYFIYHSMYSAVTAFAVLVCAYCPMAAVAAGSLPMAKVSKTLRRFGSVLSGAKSLEDIGSTNAVVVSAQDLFPEGTLVLHGIKTFGSGRVDEAILDAASVILNIGGTLADAFNQVIVGKQDILRPVDTLVYEDTMGVSAWVDQKRVLIGNRDLMRHHGIDAPTKDYEARYRKDGRDLIYLANSGEITAMFVVSYTGREDIGDALYYLIREGVSVVVNTTDSNITAQKIAQVFEVEQECISIMPGKLHGEYAPLAEQKARAGCALCHIGSFAAFARGVISAKRAGKVYSIIGILLIISAVLGYAAAAFFVFISGLSQLTAAVLLIYQLFWSLILLITPNIKRL